MRGGVGVADVVGSSTSVPEDAEGLVVDVGLLAQAAIDRGRSTTRAMENLE